MNHRALVCLLGSALALSTAACGGSNTSEEDDEDVVSEDSGEDGLGSSESCLAVTQGLHQADPSVEACWPYDGAPDALVVLGTGSDWRAEFHGGAGCESLVEEGRTLEIRFGAGSSGPDFEHRSEIKEDGYNYASLGEGVGCSLAGRDFACAFSGTRS